MFTSKKVLIAACEAGGAQLLSSMLKVIDLKDCVFVLEGPARLVFQKNLGSISIRNYSEQLIEDCDFVLTGTSLIPALERKAIACAKQKERRVISIIDHWVHYRERFIPQPVNNFSGNIESVLPDEIWVSDDYAYDIAVRNSFPEHKIVLIDNYYFHNLQRVFQGEIKSETDKKKILYVCEPVFDDLEQLYGNGNYWGYNEFDLISDLLKSVDLMSERVDTLILRLHPNEGPDKYNFLIKEYKGKTPLKISNPAMKSIEEDCQESDYIIGVESMALVVGLHFGKKVFSCLPASANKKCCLPHKKIRRINSVHQILEKSFV